MCITFIDFERAFDRADCSAMKVTAAPWETRQDHHDHVCLQAGIREQEKEDLDNTSQPVQQLLDQTSIGTSSGGRPVHLPEKYIYILKARAERSQLH